MSYSPGQQNYFNDVWNLVRQVPSGKLVTYGQIAQSLPQPQDFNVDEQSASIAQLVGSAMAMCPADVPWHRVVNAQGRVSSRIGAGKQIQLLEAEGLIFVNDRIDLKQYQWHGPNEADKPEQHQLF